jgi:hypothetical protein
MFDRINYEKYAEEVKRRQVLDYPDYGHKFTAAPNFVNFAGKTSYSYDYETQYETRYRIESEYVFREANLMDLLKHTESLAKIKLLHSLGWTILEDWTVRTKGEEEWLDDHQKNGGGAHRIFSIDNKRYLCFEKSETAAFHQLTWR